MIQTKGKYPTKKEALGLVMEHRESLRQEGIKSERERIKKEIVKVHKHWHPIDKQGITEEEKCTEDNCPFRHLEQQISEGKK